jgi:Cu/Ag efflux protein CusF
MNGRSLFAIVALAAATAWPLAAVAQRVEHGRGNIVSIDKDRQTIQLKDPQGRTGTWRYNRNATVKFTDGPGFFPNPSTADLRPPMYVHFTFTNEVIESFDVVELGYQPGNEESASGRKEPGTPRTVIGRVTAYDANAKQVEVEHDGLRETFQLNDRSNQRLQAGQRVQLRTEWSGPRETVIETRLLAGTDTGRFGSGGAIGRSDRRTQSASGRVVGISEQSVVLQVEGAQRSYAVDDAALLQRLRVGQTVQFQWRTDANGRMYITSVR